MRERTQKLRTRAGAALGQATASRAGSDSASPTLPELLRLAQDSARLAQIDELGQEWTQHARRNERINSHIRRSLTLTDIHQGRTLEIGAREHPRRDVFGSDEWDYCILDIEDFESDDPSIEYVIGDITNCPNIPDNSYDVVISVDVFEHVNRPWLAASEISRILRPGGLSYTSTLFAWRFHPVPIDYWRFTPDCLQFLFSELDTIECDFDTVERRRDVRGRGKRDRVPVDALGGFRENWRVYHVGRKPTTAPQQDESPRK